LNVDIDGNSAKGGGGTGMLGTVLRYAPLWFGYFSGQSTTAGGNTVNGINALGSYLNNGAAFYPSTISSQVGSGGNKLWFQHQLAGDGEYVTILPSAATIQLTGANAGLNIITGSTAGTITLPTLVNTAGQANTQGIRIYLFNRSSQSQTISTGGTLLFNGQAGFTSKALAAGVEMECIGYYNTTTSTYEWRMNYYTPPTSDIGGDELWGMVMPKENTLTAALNNYAFAG
jgi:hypothetical protein